MFQTQGDVTITNLLKATMLFSGDRPRTLTISAPSLPERAMRTIRRYAELGYIARLRLLLGEQPDATVFNGFAVEIELAITPNAPSLLMWQGSTNTAVIQGTMPDTVTPSLHLYAGLLCGNQSTTLRNATDAFEALFRSRYRRMQQAEAEAATVAAKTVASASPDAPAVQSAGVLASENKKKSNRKTKKSNEKSNQSMATTSATEESR